MDHFKKINSYCTTVLISHTSKVILKSFKQGFSSTRIEKFYKMGLQTAEKPETELPTSIGAQRKKNIYFCFTDYTKVVDSVDQTNWKILKEMGVPDHLICLLRNPYADQEATVRTGHGIMDWFQIWKGARQGCILSLCLFNLYAEYIMQSTSWNQDCRKEYQ